MKSRLTYILGPLSHARPAIANMQEIEKQVVNLAGATTIAPSSSRLRNMKKPEAAKQIAPHMYDLSFVMKLKILNQP